MCGNPFKKPKTVTYTAPVTEAPAPTPTAPTMTEIKASDNASAVGDEVERNKKKRGYASTRTSAQADASTIAGSATGKKTLG